MSFSFLRFVSEDFWLVVWKLKTFKSFSWLKYSSKIRVFCYFMCRPAISMFHFFIISTPPFSQRPITIKRNCPSFAENKNSGRKADEITYTYQRRKRGETRKACDDEWPRLSDRGDSFRQRSSLQTSKKLKFMTIILINSFFCCRFFCSDSSISTRVDMLTTPAESCGQPGIWHKDDTLENFGMKPSTSDLWREVDEMS